MTSTPSQLVIATDVGTTSVRSALVSTTDGIILAKSTLDTTLYNPQSNHYEQDCTEIWTAVRQTIQHCVAELKQKHRDIDVHHAVVGWSFDATCSDVYVGHDGQPLAITQSGDKRHDILMWLDHRAGAEAEQINKTKHPILDNTGGGLSIEMHIPKLLWVKKHLPDTYKQIQHVFDLTDWLTYKATGNTNRSICTITCKTTFQQPESGSKDSVDGFDSEFFRLIGLEDHTADGYQRLVGPNVDNHVLSVGAVQGTIRSDVAHELGLNTTVKVAAGLIDADSGWLGIAGAEGSGSSTADSKIENRIGVIAGTSTCHMLVTKEKIPVSGIWGAYRSPILPSYYLLEGGQSATGKLLEHIIDTHVHGPAARKEAKQQGLHTSEYLNKHLHAMAQQNQLQHMSELTRHLHIDDSFHGNRAPLANSDMLGQISGLTLFSDTDALNDLCRLYLAALQSICYGTKHIIDIINAAGAHITAAVLTGGLVHNKLAVQLHADILQMPIYLPAEDDSVLVGTAISAAVGAGIYAKLEDAMQYMSRIDNIVQPNTDNNVVNFHRRKYQVYRRMLTDQLAYRAIMNGTDQL